MHLQNLIICLIISEQQCINSKKQPVKGKEKNLKRINLLSASENRTKLFEPK